MNGGCELHSWKLVVLQQRFKQHGRDWRFDEALGRIAVERAEPTLLKEDFKEGLQNESCLSTEAHHGSRLLEITQGMCGNQYSDYLVVVRPKRYSKAVCQEF
jgi:hypothetical protein